MPDEPQPLAPSDDETRLQKSYRPHEVATMLNVSTWTVNRWIKQNKVTAFKLNGYWRVTHSSLIELLNQRHGS